MKTLHIIDKLGLGGPQTLLKEIIEKQVESNAIILYVLRETDIIIDIEHPKVNVYPSNNIFSFKPLKELNNIIEYEKIDVLHCHGYRAKVFGWLLKKRLASSVRLVFHEHGDIFRNNKFYNLLLRLSISEVDLNLACSKATKQQLIKKAHIPEDKIEVLYNFVDLNRYNRKNSVWDTEEERKKMGVSIDDFIIGFAGRIVGVKGWKLFIDAAKLLSGNLSNAKFVVAGDGKDKVKLLKLIGSYHLNSDVIYVGYITDMVWFYSVLNCLVLPSYRESMPLAVIEAQAMGIPVIASNIETLTEIICDEENGLFFELHNEKELAEKIRLLFEDDNLKRKIISGGLKTVQKYSLNVYIENLNNIYDGLL